VIDIGLEQLRACITASHPDDICTTAAAELGVERPDDDVAILALRRKPAEPGAHA
jgi:hypothetical protein